jgi:5-methylcytosine-specific restriction endonuclease McrA
MSRCKNQQKKTRRHLPALLEAQRGLCFHCGYGHDDMTIDHVQPLSRGGSNDVGNLVAACRPCNTRRGTKTVDEFRRSRFERSAPIILSLLGMSL